MEYQVIWHHAGHGQVWLRLSRTVLKRKEAGTVIGLKGWNPARRGLTLLGRCVLTGVASPGLVQGCTKPVGGGPRKGPRPIGQNGQNGQDGGTQQALVGQRLEGEGVTSISLVTAAVVISRSPKSSGKCKANAKIGIKVKIVSNDEIVIKAKIQWSAELNNGARPCYWVLCGRGVKEREIVPGGGSASRIPPPVAAKSEGQESHNDHLWSPTGLTEKQNGCLQCNKSEESKQQDGCPNSNQGQK